MENKELYKKGKEAYDMLRRFLKANRLRLEVCETFPHQLVVIGDDFEFYMENGKENCFERDSIYEDWDEDKEFGAGSIMDY